MWNVLLVGINPEPFETSISGWHQKFVNDVCEFPRRCVCNDISEHEAGDFVDDTITNN